MRVVAPDYGSARSGVAVSNPTDQFSEDSRAGRTY
jgi:RNase H-fold protein (predicted Holliday junction resolvase)